MTDEQIRVPPEVTGELEQLQQAGDLDPNDRAAAIQAAAERDFDAAVKWLEQVGEEVYAQAARGQFIAGDEA